MESTAKKVVKCDHCRDTVDFNKPKKGEPPNDGIQAILSAGPLGQTKEFHFCSELCLKDFLNARYRTSKANVTVLGRQKIEFDWTR